jgi:hypothetical protein
MSGLFLLPSAVKRDPAIDTWLSEPDNALRRIARTWFERMRSCGDDVRELMHDGCPTACVGDAAFGYVNAFRAHVNVGFYYGAKLRDPAGLLAGTGKRMRHVKLLRERDLDVGALTGLVTAAYDDIRLRLTST